MFHILQTAEGLYVRCKGLLQTYAILFLYVSVPCCSLSAYQILIYFKSLISNAISLIPLMLHCYMTSLWDLNPHICL
jgi:hypothetical protein